MTTKRFRALMMPGDAPPRRSSLKRQLLFFDSVALTDLADAALVNENEVEIRSPMRTVRWAQMVPFPRADGYADAVSSILSETIDLQRDGKVSVLTREQARRAVDPGSQWAAAQLIIRDADVVRAAVPDLVLGDAPPIKASNAVFGITAHPSDIPNPYPFPEGAPAELPGADVHWNRLAHVRAARVTKYLRIASATGHVPVAVDEPTATIMTTVGRRAYRPTLPAELVADATIAADAVDAEALDRVLVNLPWREVLKLRRLVLPRVAQLREVLLRRARLVSRAAALDPRVLEQELSRIRSEYDRAQEELGKRWTEAKIGAPVKLAAMAGAGVVGLASMSLPASLAAVTQFAAIATLVGVVPATVITELKGWLATRDAVQGHPLFFFDTLPKTIKSET